ncbi:hypothetical protein [Streptomyces sp. CB03238]|uniref:hypothetical protein n=1 Tax=Streptomyces sp. CB03238 TaxID=1907777 RepID=UPI000A11A1EB|nr:hypothetical protein [Streptomyces sp. CB03238]ORT54390.1 hypothetical protein BKD26_35570 [Streptomyces sp. CB03238]
MEYQVDIWDRYSWDQGKSTPSVPWLTVSDADMARLHTVGLGQEYNVHGSSDVMTRGVEDPVVTPPSATGRQDERTDLERDQKR